MKQHRVQSPELLIRLGRRASMTCRACCCRELADCNPRVHYMDCANPLLLKNDTSLNPLLINDGVHPTVKGFDVLFSGWCVLDPANSRGSTKRMSSVPLTCH